MPAMIDTRQQAVTGLVPPSQGEALIREAWPSVTATPGVAGLGEKLARSIILAPLALILFLPLYFKKILPFIAKRYTLTNKRLMIRRGLKPKPACQIDLADIEDVPPGAWQLQHLLPGGHTGSYLERTGCHAPAWRAGGRGVPPDHPQCLQSMGAQEE